MCVDFSFELEVRAAVILADFDSRPLAVLRCGYAQTREIKKLLTTTPGGTQEATRGEHRCR